MGVFAMGQGGSVWGRGFYIGQRIPYRIGVFAMGQGAPCGSVGFYIGQRIPYRMGVFAMGQGDLMWGKGVLYRAEDPV